MLNNKIKYNITEQQQISLAEDIKKIFTDFDLKLMQFSITKKGEIAFFVHELEKITDKNKKFEPIVYNEEEEEDYDSQEETINTKVSESNFSDREDFMMYAKRHVRNLSHKDFLVKYVQINNVNNGNPIDQDIQVSFNKDTLNKDLDTFLGANIMAKKERLLAEAFIATNIDNDTIKKVTVKL